jgi:hypothetical protein
MFSLLGETGHDHDINPGFRSALPEPPVTANPNDRGIGTPGIPETLGIPLPPNSSDIRGTAGIPGTPGYLEAGKSTSTHRTGLGRGGQRASAGTGTCEYRGAMPAGQRGARECKCAGSGPFSAAPPGTGPVHRSTSPIGCRSTNPQIAWRSLFRHRV